MGIITTINAQTRNRLSLDQLADYLKEQTWENGFAAQLVNFFTDCPLKDLAAFAEQYNISDRQIKSYYEKYIKEYYRNQELEEMLAYVDQSS